MKLPTAKAKAKGTDNWCHRVYTHTVVIFGQPMARVGDRVACPKCGDTHIIVEGVQHVSSDRLTALEGMRTSCGATLIASQHFYQLEYG